MQMPRLMLAMFAITACRSAEPPSRVIVSNENAGTVSVIDPDAGRVISVIEVGKRPRGMRVSRDGRTLYVALSGSPKAPPGVDEATLPPADRAADGIGVVDLTSMSLVRTIESGQDPEAFDLVGDDLLVVSNEETSEASIVDLRQRRVRVRVRVGGEPEGVTTAPDGLVWVTSEEDHTASVIDPQQGTVVATVATGLRPRAIAFHGTRGVITGENDGSLTIVDTHMRAAVGRIQLPTTGAVPPRPVGVAIAADGRRAYVATGRAGGVAIVDLDAREVVDVIEGVGTRPWGITLARDGLLYTANGPSDDVSVIDPGTAAIVRRIRSGGSPWGAVSL
jgi:YVTN family beta-propeller protein